jgi:pantoate--beta-alanine ligase
VYPSGYRTYVEVTELQSRLCGESRPAHFRGVCTIVLKLFNTVCPDRAFFGQKDAQQAIILKKMVKDLNLDIDIEVLPIVRDSDGLALSSRNSYLTGTERRAAGILYTSLQRAKELVMNGERSASVLLTEMEKLIASEPLARIDYLKIVEVEGLEPIHVLEGTLLVAMAVFVGTTRLIDNMIIEIEGASVRVKE